MRDPNFATLAVVYRFPEAAVLFSMLRAYGVPAFAPTWNFATVNWSLTVAIGGIMVVVPTRDLDAAIFLVGDPAEMPSPPRNFRGGWLRNALLVMLLWFFIGLYLPARARGCYARTEAA